MSPLNIAILMLVIFGVLTAFRMPMGISLGFASVVGIMLMKALGLTVLGQTAFTALQSYPLIAIPLYIFAGNVMGEGGIAEKLVNLVSAYVSRVAGGLAMVQVIASTFFSAISGSSTATTVAIGGIMMPQMEKRGYDKEFTLALAAAGGVIGPIIPPSVGMVLYGVVTNASIGQLFIGGVLPGIMMMLVLMFVVYFIAKKRGYQTEKKQDILQDKKKVIGLRAFWETKWALMSPVIILGGIYCGIFTPTEAGAVVSVYSIIVTVMIEKRITFKRIWELFIDTCTMSAKILFLVGIATVFGRVMTMAQIPQMLTEAIISFSSNPIVAMLMINLFLLFVGCIMEASSSIIILAPILLPVAEYFGYGAVHFGVILVTNLTIGAITPPVGCCLFAASAMGNVKIERIAKEALPFLFALLGVLFLEIYFEPLVMFLPKLVAR